MPTYVLIKGVVWQRYSRLFSIFLIAAAYPVKIFLIKYQEFLLAILLELFAS